MLAKAELVDVLAVLGQTFHPSYLCVFLNKATHYSPRHLISSECHRPPSHQKVSSASHNGQDLYILSIPKCFYCRYFLEKLI